MAFITSYVSKAKVLLQILNLGVNRLTKVPKRVICIAHRVAALSMRDASQDEEILILPAKIFARQNELPLKLLTMVQISEVKGTCSSSPPICSIVSNTICAGTARENRVAAHSHIKGLGLRDDGTADKTAAGFIGQQQAREVNTQTPTRSPSLSLFSPPSFRE